MGSTQSTWGQHSSNMPLSTKKTIIASVCGIVTILVIITIATSAKRVKAGHVGVAKMYGKVDIDNPLREGLNWLAPFVYSVHQMDTRMAAASHQSIASSKDLQTVTTDITCQYHLVGYFVPVIYQKLGTIANVERTIITPAIQESLKSVTAKYTAEELVTKRETVKLQIKSEILDFIQTTMASKGIQGGILIAIVAITDFEFSPEFNKAIEMKVRAEQEALQAENEKLKKITEAEAAAEQQRLAADAQAYEIEKESQAR